MTVSPPDHRFRFFDLEGQTLCITGVTRGIGRAILPELLRQGLNLILISRDQDRVAKTVADLAVHPSRIKTFTCDLQVPAEVDAVATAILRSTTSIDGVLHNAAIDDRSPFEDSPQSFWEKIFQVNLLSAVALTRRLLPVLRARGRGRILFTGSVMADLGGGRLTAYASSKAALEGLTRALAHELKGTGITVNCLIPGAIRVEKEGFSSDRDARINSWQSVNRRLVPDDLTGPIALLLSAAGGAISGQSLTVDGGLFHPLADPDLQSAISRG
jgi:3-oxoacyl-[acyl-carrier protein] reductase